LTALISPETSRLFAVAQPPIAEAIRRDQKPTATKGIPVGRLLGDDLDSTLSILKILYYLGENYLIVVSLYAGCQHWRRDPDPQGSRGILVR